MSDGRSFSKVLQHAQQREGAVRAPAAEHGPQPATPVRENAWFALHRTVGNQAMQRMLAQRGQAPSEPIVQRGLLDDAWNAASDFVSDTADSVSDAASSAADWVSDTAGEVGQTVSETAGGVWNTVAGAGERALGLAQRFGERAVGLVQRFGERALGLVQRFGERAVDLLQRFGERALGLVQRFGERAVDLLQRFGERALDLVQRFGERALDLLQRIGTLALDVFERVGQTLFEKAMFYTDVFWSFISNIPDRLWRLLIDGWEGIQGMASWLGAGFSGLLDWLRSGLSGAADWAIAFLQSPSLDALADGVKRFLRHMGSGAMGALRWVWDGISSGAMWALRVALHLLELLGLGEFLSALWGTIFHLRPLDASEIGASSSVHGGGQVPYNIVWVDEGSLVARISNAFTGGHTEAVTTMHILHLPHAGVMSGELAVHELTHVAQYEKVGGIYMAQAVHAQIAGSQYDYGNLTGKHFRELDREAQAELCGDYYKLGGDGADAARTHRSRGGSVNSIGTIRSLIGEMRGGAY